MQAPRQHYDTELPNTLFLKSPVQLNSKWQALVCKRKAKATLPGCSMQRKKTDLHLLLGELKAEGIQVTPDVALTSGLGDNAGSILDSPPDQHLQTNHILSTSS